MLELVNKSSKAVEYKMNIRNQWCFHMLIMKYQKGNVKKNLKKKRYLIIKVNKEIKDLYSEN